jgi:hypothetical protein
MLSLSRRPVMSNRNSIALDKPEDKQECKHYWVIEGARGPTSRGVCKFCGKEQEFQNSWYDSAYMGKDARVLKLPDLLEEEPEKVTGE